MSDPIKIISWNVCKSPGAWQVLVDDGVDLALLQEAQAPPAHLAQDIQTDEVPWATGGSGSRNWRTAVAGLSDRVRVGPWPRTSLASPESGALPVSLLGSLAVADVELADTGETITVASMYGTWERPVASSSWIYADASVHRLISDLSALIGSERGHRIVVAGDLNILKGYGENGSPYWAGRYATVFSRMESLGLCFVGPQAPGGGCQVEPWPVELPKDCRNVPTFRTSRGRPETATRQLDFVFASDALRPRMRASALNAPDDWGPSDHCRVLIELQV
jgi:hypothetical protein